MEPISENEEPQFGKKFSVAEALPDAGVKNSFRPKQVTKSQKSKSSSCFPCMKKQEPFHQTLVILRHSERRDYMEGAAYKVSEEGQKWPYDTPITPNGFELARKVAQELAELHNHAHFVAIASSPFRRCLETASEVAKLLRLPIVIDQEIGEIWDMPKEPLPFRSPTELPEMCASLGLQVLNPVLEDGSYKLFGKPPAKAGEEGVEDAKNRFIVRIENYIEQSAGNKQNFILVTHADAVVAILEMFKRGYADVKQMDFCARVIAQRDVMPKKKELAGVYSDDWTMDHAAVNMSDNSTNMDRNEGMGKLYEKMHIKKCEETEQMYGQRRDRRTKTDAVFDKTIGALQTDDPSSPKV